MTSYRIKLWLNTESLWSRVYICLCILFRRPFHFDANCDGFWGRR